MKMPQRKLFFPVVIFVEFCEIAFSEMFTIYNAYKFQATKWFLGDIIQKEYQANNIRKNIYDSAIISTYSG